MEEIMELLIGLAIYLVAGVFLIWLLFVSYVFVMGAKRVRDRKTLTPLAYVLSWPVLVVGVAVDVIVNQLYFSVICLDPFHFGTVTSRMKRYKYRDSTDWQKKVSAFVELHIDDFEDVEGGHI
jgi:hypothetical protein